MLPHWHRGQLCFGVREARRAGWVSIGFRCHSAADAGPSGRIKQPHCMGPACVAGNAAFLHVFGPPTAGRRAARAGGPLIESAALRDLAHLLLPGRLSAHAASGRHANAFGKTEAASPRACNPNPFAPREAARMAAPAVPYHLHARLGLPCRCAVALSSGLGQPAVVRCHPTLQGMRRCPFFPFHGNS